jgi:hypothetical protein
VEIFQFDRGEKIIQMYGSEGLRATRIADGDGQMQLTCLRVEPGVSSERIQLRTHSFS